MASLLVSSAVLAAKGRVRVSKHSQDELAQLGCDAQDSGSEESAWSNGEEDDEPRAKLVGGGRPRSAVPRGGSGSSPLANVGSVRLSPQW